MIPQPLELHTEIILPEWIDYNGHMNVAYYTLVFDHAVDEFFSYVGLDQDYRGGTTNSTFAVEHHITYNQEVVEGDVVRCTSRLVGFDKKRIHHYHEMYHVADGYLVATGEFLSLHIDLSIRRVTTLPDPILDNLGDVMAAHEKIAPSANIGRVIKKPKPPAR